MCVFSGISGQAIWERSRGPLVLTTRELFSFFSCCRRDVAFLRLAASWLKKTLLKRVLGLSPGSCGHPSTSQQMSLPCTPSKAIALGVAPAALAGTLQGTLSALESYVSWASKAARPCRNIGV